MIAVVPQMRIWLAIAPVDFRKQIDGLVAVCRQQLGHEPLSGALYLFRNRRGTAIKCLVYDGSGFWCCHKRFSEGRIRWWPKSSGESLTPLLAKQLQIVLYNGNPESAQLPDDWHRI